MGTGNTGSRHKPEECSGDLVEALQRDERLRSPHHLGHLHAVSHAEPD